MKRVIFHILLLYCCHSGCAQTGSTEWPFAVTPENLPKVDVYLSAPTISDPALGVRLIHRLIFDGARYRSRMLIDILNSHVVSAETVIYVWETPDARSVRLVEGNVNKAFGTSWKLHRFSDALIIIASTDGAIYFEYHKCLLRKATILGATYEFISSNDSLIILRKKGSDTPTTFLSALHRDGLVYKLTISRGTFDLRWNNRFELAQISDHAASPKTMTFHFADGLLESVINGTHRQNCSWGRPQLKQYFSFLRPLTPVVIDDGQFRYHTFNSKDISTTSVYSLDGAYQGKWMLLKSSERVNLNTRKQTSTFNFARTVLSTD